MFFHGLLLAVLAITSASSNVIEKEVGDEWSRIIFCPSSFGFCRGPQDYKFSAPSGKPIEISCRTFRTARCDKASLTFNDGISDFVKCGDLETFQITTQTSEVTAKLAGVGGFIDCSAKTIRA